MVAGNRLPMQMGGNMSMMSQGASLLSHQRQAAPPPYINPVQQNLPNTGSPLMSVQHGPSPGVPTQFMQSPGNLRIAPCSADKKRPIFSPGSAHSGMPSPGPRSSLAQSPMSVPVSTPQNDNNEEQVTAT